MLAHDARLRGQNCDTPGLMLEGAEAVISLNILLDILHKLAEHKERRRRSRKTAKRELESGVTVGLEPATRYVDDIPLFRQHLEAVELRRSIVKPCHPINGRWKRSARWSTVA
jgi:hypothetical protein